MNVDQVESLVQLDLKEKGVLQEYQALADKESLERRVVREDQEILDLLVNLVQKVIQE